MTILLAPLPIQSFRDSNGNPLAGGLLYTYQAGTSTLQSTFTDASGATPNANPVVLNSRGEASVWLTSAQAFKLVLQDSYGVLIWSVDQVASGASSGANSDISSLTGLTTALSIAQGGTGAITANAGADALGAFRRGTLLGTVSQTTGVPTGAVIERGSNANGEYVRWADGTQICTLTTEGNEILSTALANVFVSNTEQTAKPFPAVFVGIPVRSQRASSATAGVSLPAPLSRWVTGQFWGPQQAYALTNVGTVYMIHEYLAVGRWF